MTRYEGPQWQEGARKPVDITVIKSENIKFETGLWLNDQ